MRKLTLASIIIIAIACVMMYPIILYFFGYLIVHSKTNSIKWWMEIIFLGTIIFSPFFRSSRK